MKKARQRFSRALWPAVGVAALVMSATASCKPAAPPAPPKLSASADAPGALLSAEPVTDIDAVVRDTGARVFRIRYGSTSAWNDKPVTVSGTALLPPGDPPAGGWPVMALAHGTSGILPECGPSLSPDLFGSATPAAGFVRQGFAVVVPDYEGLGAPGVHAYLDAKAAGRNVVDAVRALRAVRPGAVSDRWLMIGGSQGGGAVWAANEQAAVRAPELHLLGAVALVPAADMSAYVDLASAGTLGPDQTAAYVWMLMAQGRGRPGLDLDRYRRGSAARNWQKLSYCYGPHAEERGVALAQIVPDELKPATPADAARMKQIFRTMALPQRKADAPMLVIYAGKDSFIDPAWTRGAMAAACRMGSRIEAIFQPEKGHGTVDIAPALEWLGHRLAGDPLTGASACAS